MSEVVALPQYQSHKKVTALKIKSVVFDETTGRATITPALEGYAPFEVSGDYVRKHFDHVAMGVIEGGYFVQYGDGYQSFSPAEAFEGGYTLIKQMTFQDRVREELAQLSDRCQKLAKFLDSETFHGLLTDEQGRLTRQYGIMLAYEVVLQERISHWG